MGDFVTLCDVKEIPSGGCEVFGVENLWIAVFHIDGKFYAIQDVCTHDDGPLADGTLTDCIVKCPRHGARFDVTNGKFLSGPAGTVDVPTYKIRVVENELQVKIPE